MDYLENAQVSHRTATLKPCDRPIYEVDEKVYLNRHKRGVDMHIEMSASPQLLGR